MTFILFISSLLIHTYKSNIIILADLNINLTIYLQMSGPKHFLSMYGG
jgi:hypothetical protein